MKVCVLVTIIALAALTSCQKNGAGSTAKKLDGPDFQSFISQPGTLNIVDFHADWCGPCKKLAPILAEVAEANSDLVRLGKINVDNNREFASQQGVQGIPDVRFYINGKMVQKFSGTYPKEKIERMIETHRQSVSSTDSLGDPQGVLPTNENPLPPGMSVE